MMRIVKSAMIAKASFLLGGGSIIVEYAVSIQVAFFSDLEY
jgi:hypothetical protein